jgi:hypothetical protein
MVGRKGVHFRAAFSDSRRVDDRSIYFRFADELNLRRSGNDRQFFYLQLHYLFMYFTSLADQTVHTLESSQLFMSFGGLSRRLTSTDAIN